MALDRRVIGGLKLLHVSTVTLEVLELRSFLVLLGLGRTRGLVGGRLGGGDASLGSRDGLGLFAVEWLATLPCSCRFFAAVVKTLDGGHRRAWSCMFCRRLCPGELRRLGQS